MHTLFVAINYIKKFGLNRPGQCPFYNRFSNFLYKNFLYYLCCNSFKEVKSPSDDCILVVAGVDQLELILKTNFQQEFLGWLDLSYLVCHLHASQPTFIKTQHQDSMRLKKLFSKLHSKDNFEVLLPRRKLNYSC